jgi:hypothetical protein
MYKMKSKLRLLAAVLVAGGTMFAAQSRPFVGNGAAGYGSGSTSSRTVSYRNDDRRVSFDRSDRNDRGFNNDRRDDRRFDNRFDNRWDARSHRYVDDCRR